MNMLRKEKLNIFYYFFSSLILAFSTFIFNYSVVNGLSVDTYADWSYQVGIALIVFSIFFEWIRVSIIRLGVKNRNWLKHALAIFSLHLIFGSCVFAIIHFVFEVKILVAFIYVLFHITHEAYLAYSRVTDPELVLYRKIQTAKSIVFAVASIVLCVYVSFNSDLFLSILIFFSYLILVFFLTNVKVSLLRDYVVKQRLSLKRMSAFIRFGVPIVIVSASSLSIFYIDRIMLKVFNDGMLIAETAAISDLVRQIFIFPINLISIYFINKEISALSSDGRTLKKLLFKKVFIFLMVNLFFVCVVYFSLNLISEFYFPAAFKEYWEAQWHYFVFSYFIFTFKVYFFDQYFILIKKTNLVAVFSVLLLLFYIFIMYFQIVFYSANVGESFMYANLLTLLLYLVVFAKHTLKGNS